MRILLLCIGFFVGIYSLAKDLNGKKTYYIGGGGEPSEMFDQSFREIQKIEKRGWSVDYMYGGASESANKTMKELGPKVQLLNTKNLNDKLSQIENDLKQGKSLPSQIMIYLDTHGGYSDGKYSIYTANGTVEVLPALHRIKELAKKRGVKLGIIGGTCYSGNLLDLADTNTCVLSISPHDVVGFTHQSQKLNELLTSGSVDNLEQLHLMGRSKAVGKISQPLISTEAGRKSFELLRPLKNHLIGANQFKNQQNKQICRANLFDQTLFNLDKMKNQINDLFLNAQLMFDELKLKQFDKKAEKLRAEYGQYALEFMNMDCEDVVYKKKTYQSCFYMAKEVDEKIDNMKKYSHELIEKMTHPRTSKAELAEAKTDMAYVENELKYFELVKKTKLYQRKKAMDHIVPMDIKLKFYEFSEEVGEVENDLYNKLYSYFSKQNKKNEPCAEFKI